jgi:hypothetical protein
MTHRAFFNAKTYTKRLDILRKKEGMTSGGLSVVILAFLQDGSEVAHSSTIPR